MGHVYAWGSNSHGQLGLGIICEQVVEPTKITDLSNHVEFITGGGKHTIAGEFESAQIYTCGCCEKCQSSGSANLTLLLDPFQSPVKKVSCGWDFNIVLLENNTVYVWGSNSFGQLGFSRTKCKQSSSPLKVDQIACVDIAAGLRHSVLLSLSGTVFTSGSNSKGQLGYSTSTKPAISESFCEVAWCKKIVKVCCGENFSLAVTDDEEVIGWGDNKFGQLALPPDKTVHVPFKLQITQKYLSITSIHSGWTHASILTEPLGKIISWGRNDYGQLGEIRNETWVPKFLDVAEAIEELAVGSHHSIALTRCGRLLSWGWNEHGNCGNGKLENVMTPSPVSLPKEITPHRIGCGAGCSFFIT